MPTHSVNNWARSFISFSTLPTRSLILANFRCYYGTGIWRESAKFLFFRTSKPGNCTCFEIQTRDRKAERREHDANRAHFKRFSLPFNLHSCLELLWILKPLWERFLVNFLSQDIIMRTKTCNGSDFYNSASQGSHGKSSEILGKYETIPSPNALDFHLSARE